jgi:GAF domain-containing protein/HAMP domain-containing protein
MREEVFAMLSILKNKDPEYIISYALLDKEGNTLEIFPHIKDQNITAVGSENLDQVGNLWMTEEIAAGLKSALQTNTNYISPVVFDDENTPSLYFAVNMTTLDSEYNGQIVARYNALILQKLIEANNGLAGTESFGVLFDENQLHLAHGTAPDTLYKTVNALPVEDVLWLQEMGRLPSWPLEDLSTNLPDLSQQLRSSEPIYTATDVATGDRVNQVAQLSINSKPWKVAFFQPRDVFLASVEEQTRNTIILLLVIAGVVAITSVGATRILVAPINTLTQIVEHIAAGDLTLQAPVFTRDEIGRLATTFNAMTAQVRSLLSGLEFQVEKRTREYERQAIQLQTAAEVARDASNLQDLGELLDRTVNLIQDRFGFYHAGIFLLDERREFALLRAANSEGGREMIRNGHKLRVGQTGIVGYVTSSGEPRIAREVDADASHFAHPLLPETQSEMALPLIVGDRIIGALDVQSMEPNAFDEADITVLQVLSDQLAVAIENTRLLTEVRQTVHELQSAYGEYTQDSWERWVQLARKSTGYRYFGTDIEPTTEQSPEAVMALKQGKMVTRIIDDEGQSSIAIPIQLRDKTIGVVDLQFEGDDVPPEMVNLIDNLTNRLATALDSARLYEETRRRAAQEQLTSEIASNFRESLDIDSVIKTAVQEIGQKLSLHAVSIQLDMDNNSTPERES